VLVTDVCILFARNKLLRTLAGKMADGVDIDLYADDIEQDFAQVLCIYK